MFDNRDYIDFGKEDIPKLFGSIFLPTLFGMIFSIAFILSDGIFIGHGVGAYGLASVNLIAPLMMIINGTGMMFGIGTSVVAAIHMAKDNVKAARLNVTQSFIAAFAVGGLLILVLYLFPNSVVRLLGVSDQLFAPTKEYYLWFIPTCVLLMGETLGMFVIRLDGSPTYAMLVNIIPALTNILFDYIFIFPCHWGLMGAALATDIGGMVGTLMVFYYMAFKAKTLKFCHIKHTITSLRLSLRNVGYMVKLGLSGFIGELAMAVLMLAGNLMFGHYLGDDGIAAFSVVCYIFPIIFMTYSAIAQSAQPIISYNYGAGASQRVSKTLRHSLLIAIAVGVAFTLTFVLAAKAIIQVFISPDTAPFGIAVGGLPIFAVGFPFMAVNLVIIGYLQSIEKARTSTWLTLLRGIVFMAASFVIMPIWMGELGLWLAVPVTELLTFAVILVTQLTKTPRNKDVNI